MLSVLSGQHDGDASGRSKQSRSEKKTLNLYSLLENKRVVLWSCGLSSSCLLLTSFSVILKKTNTDMSIVYKTTAVGAAAYLLLVFYSPLSQ